MRAFLRRIFSSLLQSRKFVLISSLLSFNNFTSYRTLCSPSKCHHLHLLLFSQKLISKNRRFCIQDSKTNKLSCHFSHECSLTFKNSKSNTSQIILSTFYLEFNVVSMSFRFVLLSIILMTSINKETQGVNKLSIW